VKPIVTYESAFCKSWDMGGGFDLTRQKIGSGTEWRARKLDRPGGVVVDGLSKIFGYRRDAEAWIKEMKAKS
jgi:hypothetical protein